LSRRLAAISAAIGFLLVVLPAATSRRPQFGGTLRVEIGAVVSSLDPAVPPASLEEGAAKQGINALVYDRRNPDGTFAGIAGSGPFRIAAWEPGKHVTLAANDDFREGRPFVDVVEIQMGRAAHDRLLDLEVGRVDFAEIPPEEARGATERGVRVSASEAEELVALVFLTGRPAAEDARLREALARSIDRAAIVNFILQKAGEPAGGLLPQWSSGAAFLFSTAADPPGAKELVSQIGGSPKIVLGYDSADSLEQAVAERIAVNARDAGIGLAAEPMGSTPAGSTILDAHLVRLQMPSPHPREVLTNFVAMLAPSAGIDAGPLPPGASPDQIYGRERGIVGTFRVIPLVWLPRVFGLSARVRDWRTPVPGERLPFADVWLEGNAP
jgi:hypothetical protein